MESQEPLQIDHDAKVAETAKHRAPSWTARERLGMILLGVRLLKRANPAVFRLVVGGVAVGFSYLVVSLTMIILLLIK